MLKPDQRLLQADIDDAPFQIGVAEGRWGLVEDTGLQWPMVVFWVAAAPQAGAPDRFYVRLDCANYPVDPPTGTFWDPGTRSDLDHSKRPKGRERVAMVFRTDWENGRAFYHPYDRVASKSHPNWRTEHPHHAWGDRHTIVDFLSEIHALLQLREYTGV